MKSRIAVAVTVAWLLLSFTKVANAGMASQLPPVMVGRLQQEQQRQEHQQHSRSWTKLSTCSVVATGHDTSSAAAETHGHKMSMATLVVNIVADLTPHGMLPLAYGLAQGGPTGIVTAIALAAIFGAGSAYSMTNYAYMAELTRTTSIGEMWSVLLGQDTKWIAEVSIFSLCFGCCIFYSAFVGDIFSSVASAVGISGLFARRWAILGVISACIFAPLCLLEDLSALQVSSMVGVTGIAYTVFFHLARLLDGSYASGGEFFGALPESGRPHWSTASEGVHAGKFKLFSANQGTLSLVNILCVGFLAHYNAINYSNELENTTPRRYRDAITYGFGITFVAFVSMMTLGYCIFGDAAQPLILNNFHQTKDTLATIARLATGAAITVAYPLMFAGLKKPMFNLLKINECKVAQQTACLSVLASIAAIAMKCTEEDVSVVLGIVGSVLGCSVAYIIPGVLRLTQMKKQKAVSTYPKNHGAEVLANHALVGFGAIFAILGVWVTLKSMGSHGHSHIQHTILDAVKSTIQSEIKQTISSDPVAIAIAIAEGGNESF